MNYRRRQHVDRDSSDNRHRYHSVPLRPNKIEGLKIVREKELGHRHSLVGSQYHHQERSVEQLRDEDVDRLRGPGW